MIPIEHSINFKNNTLKSIKTICLKQKINHLHKVNLFYFYNYERNLNFDGTKSKSCSMNAVLINPNVFLFAQCFVEK